MANGQNGPFFADGLDMTRRRRLADAMIAAGSIGTVVAGTAIVSVDARALLASAAVLNDPAELEAMTVRVQTFGHDLVHAAAVYRADNGPIVGFAIFAVVLTVLMFKT
jgi:hypothetical protein